MATYYLKKIGGLISRPTVGPFLGPRIAIRVIEGRVLLKPIVKPTDKIIEFCVKEH